MDEGMMKVSVMVSLVSRLSDEVLLFIFIAYLTL